MHVIFHGIQNSHIFLMNYNKLSEAFVFIFQDSIRFKDPDCEQFSTPLQL